MKKKISLILPVSLILLTSIIASCNFAPGSYPYAEEYTINKKESTIIGAVQNFKKNNPIFEVPLENQLNDGRRDSNDYWFHIYFYYIDENEIIKCWTRPDGKGNTTFAFVGINKGLEFGNWKMINKDFSDSENKNEKIKFEERILKNIKVILNDK